MPNWSEGTLKIRGTRANIKRFLTEGIEPLPSLKDQIAAMRGQEVEQPKLKIEEDEYDLTISADNGIYITGTRRAFIEQDIVWDFDDKHEEVLVINNFKQAWGVDAQSFADISKKFDIDIRIYVFECGMEFNQEIEIHKGKVITNKEIKFKDYAWDCVFPNLGG